MAASSPPTAPRRPSKSSAHSPEEVFPAKLYQLLGHDEFSSLVAWLPHGKGFAVLHRERFTTEVMPRFFKATKLRSFHRQLHLWGFHRIASGRDAGAWWHPSFLRGRPELLRRIVRTKLKGERQDLLVAPDFCSDETTQPSVSQINEARLKTGEGKPGLVFSPSSSNRSDCNMSDKSPALVPPAPSRRVSTLTTADDTFSLSMEALNGRHALHHEGGSILGFGMPFPCEVPAAQRRSSANSALTGNRDEYGELTVEEEDEFSRFIDRMIRDPLP